MSCGICPQTEIPRKWASAPTLAPSWLHPPVPSSAVLMELHSLGPQSQHLQPTGPARDYWGFIKANIAYICYLFCLRLWGQSRGEAVWLSAPSAWVDSRQTEQPLWVPKEWGAPWATCTLWARGDPLSVNQRAMICLQSWSLHETNATANLDWSIESEILRAPGSLHNP